MLAADSWLRGIFTAARARATGHCVLRGEGGGWPSYTLRLLDGSLVSIEDHQACSPTLGTLIDPDRIDYAQHALAMMNSHPSHLAGAWLEQSGASEPGAVGEALHAQARIRFASLLGSRWKAQFRFRDVEVAPYFEPLDLVALALAAARMLPKLSDSFSGSLSLSVVGRQMLSSSALSSDERKLCAAVEEHGHIEHRDALEVLGSGSNASAVVGTLMRLGAFQRTRSTSGSYRALLSGVRAKRSDKASAQRPEDWQRRVHRVHPDRFASDSNAAIKEVSEELTRDLLPR